MDFLPRVEHDERPAMEAQAYKYFAEHPEFNHTYIGFTGQEPDPKSPTGYSVQRRSEAPVYYPIHFLEPHDNFATFDYDPLSSPWERPFLERSLDTWEPSVTGPFVL